MSELEDPLAEITLQSLIRFTQPKTMMLEGKIEGKRVLVLIDSRDPSNFISTPIVKHMDISNSHLVRNLE